MGKSVSLIMMIIMGNNKRSSPVDKRSTPPSGSVDKRTSPQGGSVDKRSSPVDKRSTPPSGSVDKRSSPVDEYEAQILQWRARKYDELVRENGWLALAGLYWLKRGRNLVGSNPMCEISLPERGPTFLGIVELKGKIVRLQVAKGVRVDINGKLVQNAILKSTHD